MSALRGRSNIVHVLRAPVGGLFRHVARPDAAGKHARGHRVGIDRRHPHRRRARRRSTAPSLTPSSRARPAAACRCARQRLMAMTDGATRSVMRRIDAAQSRRRARPWRQRRRLCAPGASDERGAMRVYTPHGGSLLLRSRHAAAGKFYLAIERLLMQRGDVCYCSKAPIAPIFIATRSARRGGLVRVVHNGVTHSRIRAGRARGRRDRAGLPRRIAAGSRASMC